MKTTRRIISFLLIPLLIVETTIAFDQQIVGEGQTFAKDLIPREPMVLGIGQDNYEINGDNGSSSKMTSMELVGGSSSDMDMSQLQNNESLYGAVNDKINSMQDETSTEATAFETITNSANNRSHPDLTLDPIWETTDNVLHDVFTGDFQDCTDNATVVTNERIVHYPDYQICDRQKVQTSCEVRREITDLQIYEPEDYRCTPGEVLGEFRGTGNTTWIYTCNADGLHYDIKILGYPVEINVSTSGGSGYINNQFMGSFGYGRDGFVYFYDPTLGHLAEINMTEEQKARHVTGNLYQTCRTEPGKRVCRVYAETTHEPENYGKEVHPWFYGAAKDEYGLFVPTCDLSDTKSVYEIYDYGGLHGPRWINVLGYRQLETVNTANISRYFFDVDSIPVPGDGVADRTSSVMKHHNQICLEKYPDEGWKYDINEIIIDIPIDPQASNEVLFENPSPCRDATSNNCPNGIYEWVCKDTELKTVDGVEITPSIAAALHLSPLYEGDTLDPLCWRAVRSCVTDIGDKCITDENGVQTCTTGCTDLENDLSCGFMRSTCSMVGSSGECTMFTDTYDCGTDVAIPSQTVQQNYNCLGDIPCVDGNCIEQQSDQSDDFQKGIAMLQAISFMRQDMTCVENSSGTGGTCTVFEGEGGYCITNHWAYDDCCEDSNAPVDFYEYMQLLMMIWKRTGGTEAVVAMLTETPVYGAWTAFSDSVVSAWENSEIYQTASEIWTEMSQTATQAWESLAGTAGDAAATTSGEASSSVASSTISSVWQNLTQATAQWVYDNLGTVALDTLFSGAGGEAASTTIMDGSVGTVQWGGYTGTFLGYLAIAYMVYSLYDILRTQQSVCDEINLSTLARRQMKSCHFVKKQCVDDGPFGCEKHKSSYCCFNSPLSRILQEQIREQLNISWLVDGFSGELNAYYEDYTNENGEIVYEEKLTPYGYDCRGLTLEELGIVDWENINLDEWLAILSITDNLPQINTDFSIDGLTGTGSVLDVDGTRPNTYERTENRLDNVTEKRENLRSDMWNQE